MASKKRWVVFGAGEHANKALSGDIPDIDDISAEYITLYFTKKESLDSMIHFLEGCRKFFEDESEADND